MSYGLELRQGLEQKLNQYQVQSLQILSMDNVELEQFLQQEFEENPMFEYLPGKEPPPLLQGNAGGYREPLMVESKEEVFDDIRTLFLDQLDLSLYTKGQRAAIEYMIACLEDSGLLLISNAETARFAKIGEEECEWCRRQLTALDPPGVFARDLAECILLQLEREGKSDRYLRELVTEYLDEAAQGKLSAVAAKLSLPVSRVRAYMELIRTTNPKPLGHLYRERIPYRIPDIILKREDGKWKPELNDTWMGSYVLNDYYRHLMQETKDPELLSYFQKKYERVCQITAGIEQRRKTLLTITGAIADRQKAYLEGTGGLEPMKMQMIADAAGIHVSTVSRAIKGKYLQYPGGTVSLKELFASSYSFGGHDVTAETIRQEIRHIIGEEERSRPYSDQKIVEMLEKKGIRISRRTVAKYRETMGIRGIYERKRQREVT